MAIKPQTGKQLIGARLMSYRFYIPFQLQSESAMLCDGKSEFNASRLVQSHQNHPLGHQIPFLVNAPTGRLDILNSLVANPPGWQSSVPPFRLAV